MAEQRSASLMGRIAVHNKLISMQQLAEATAEQGRNPEKSIGNIMVEKGFISARQLQQLAATQKKIVAKQRAQQALQAHAAQPERAAPQPVESAAPQPVESAAPQPVESAAPVPAAPPSAPAVQSVPSSEPTPTSEPGAGSESGEASLGFRTATPSSQDRERLHQILRDAVAAGASDIHVHSGAPLKQRLNGKLTECGSTPIAADEAERLAVAALSDRERHALEHHGELDLCYTAEGIGRFRTNVYRQHRGFDAVFRAIPPEPSSLEQLGLPNALAKYTNYHQGMVLVTGPAGCGKSSTLAALVNLINEEREEHIISIEDPIEYVHPPKRCLVNQRHAGRHTASFARALRGALREDPDVIVIGELRDLETISLAMTAAETGHFVLATLHTNDAIRTINRMIGAFPSNQQDQVRTMLSDSLRAVISQRLVPTADGNGRLPALELLVVNKAIGNLIRDQKTTQIRSAMQTGRKLGMCLLEQSLNELLHAGSISREEALRYADDPKLITG